MTPLDQATFEYSVNTGALSVLALLKLELRRSTKVEFRNVVNSTRPGAPTIRVGDRVQTSLFITNDTEFSSHISSYGIYPGPQGKDLSQTIVIQQPWDIGSRQTVEFAHLSVTASADVGAIEDLVFTDFGFWFDISRVSVKLKNAFELDVQPA